MKLTHIRQLPKEEQLTIYKRIKSELIEEDCLTVENIVNILDGKINDLCFE